VGETNAARILKLGFLVGFFGCFIQFIQSKKELLGLTTSSSWLLSTGLISGLFFVKFFLFTGFSGGYDDPNAFGSFCRDGVPILTFAMKEAKRSIQTGVLLLAILCLGMVVVSQSRGALLSVSVASFCIAIRRNIREWVPFINFGVRSAPVLFAVSGQASDRELLAGR